jgi:hypothetical protein
MRKRAGMARMVADGGGLPFADNEAESKNRPLRVTDNEAEGGYRPLRAIRR